MSQQERHREQQKEWKQYQNTNQSWEREEKHRDASEQEHSREPRNLPPRKNKEKPAIRNFTVEESTPGKSGERNLKVQWIDMPLPEQNAISAYFKNITASGNGIKATMVQASYKKGFDGADVVETSYVPVAPVGTPGFLAVTDTTTGETQKITWQWRSSKMSLWQMIKDVIGAVVSGFKR